MRSLTLWLRRQQEHSSLSYWRSLMKRISVRQPCSTHFQYLFCLLMCFLGIKLRPICFISICFSQWWEWRKNPAHGPLQSIAEGSCLASKTRFVSAKQTISTQPHADVVKEHCVHSGADRWPSSPLSRSPATDRRILTSPVPASPTNPMRRLILSPSPLTQSEYTIQTHPAVVESDLTLWVGKYIHTCRMGKCDSAHVTVSQC